MPRKALPQNYLKSARTLFEDFETIGDWPPTNGTLVEDTVNFKSGTKSLKLTHVYGVGTMAYATKIINTNFKLINQAIVLNVFLHDEPADYYDVTIYVSSTADFSKSFNKPFKSLNRGWNSLVLGPSDWTNTNSESWDNQMVGIRIRVRANTDKTVSASFDSITYGADSMPRCLITFDDGTETAYTEGLTYMDSKGLKGTLYVVPSYIGNANYMTSAQLDDAYSKGWAISNHTYDHKDLTLYSQQEVEGKIRTADEWLLGRGYSRSAGHLSIPFGKYNSDTLAVISNLGLKTARCSVSKVMPMPPTDLKQLPILNLGNTTTLSEAKKILDSAITTGSTVIYLLHNLVGAASDGTQWAIADFQALIDYIISRDVPVVTIDEWYEGLTNPRYRSLPLSRTTV